REAQRWDAAYAGEVITLTELKAKKLDIAERKQRLLTQQDATKNAMQATQQYQAEMQEVLTYCQRIQNRLSTLDMPNKRRTLEALDITVTWSPGEDPVVEGWIPKVATASMTKCRHG